MEINGPGFWAGDTHFCVSVSRDRLDEYVRTFSPSSLTTSGTLSSSSRQALVMPLAMMAQLTIPPKMLTRMASTCEGGQWINHLVQRQGGYTCEQKASICVSQRGRSTQSESTVLAMSAKIHMDSVNDAHLYCPIFIVRRTHFCRNWSTECSHRVQKGW